MDEQQSTGDDCTEALRELHGYLDGELTPARRDAIAQHLSGCGDCHELGDFEAELRQVIAQKCRERVPDGLRDRIAAVLGDVEDARPPA